MEICGVIETEHRNPGLIASALSPDNLSGMTTAAVDGVLRTTIRSERLRSVIASVDDYLMNLLIAEELEGVCRRISV